MANLQQYCLRWNNHRSNLLTVFDQLLQNEAFTDVTLACEGGTSVKCHKMVLAACSSYFQCLFTELPCRHPVVVLKDVRYGEMKAILEYMYRGEVNVAQDQLAALLKVAEALKVKGLVEENGGSGAGGNGGSQLKRNEEEGNAITTSSTSAHAPPSSSVNSEESPPHSTGVYRPGASKSQYGMYGSRSLNVSDRNSSRVGVPVWSMQSLSIPSPQSQSPQGSMSSSVMSRCFATSPDMLPMRRKKIPNVMMSRDTPILRTVLGQGQADSSQPVPLVYRPDSCEQGNRSPFTNGAGLEQEKNQVKAEPSSGDAPSPFTDISNNEEENNERSPFTAHFSSMAHSMHGETKGGISSGIATYVTPKPEWKRYKQYTRNDILSAIEAVKSGMSTLKAARMFGVPSRTLYDKLKKLGITTTRPIRRSSNSNGSSSYQYFSGSGSVVHGVPDEEMKFSPNMVEHGYLPHVIDPGNIKREYGREAIAAMSLTASKDDSGGNLSPGALERSPSPHLIKYAHRRSLSPVSHQQMGEDSNQVEDLSVSRKPETPPSSRVIMSPINQVTPMLTSSDPEESAD